MTTYTNQSLFDTIATHLLAQGERSANVLGECQYRGPKGLKCAAGAIIPDNEYTPYIENQRVPYLIEQSKVPAFQRLSQGQQYLLDRLQELHDQRDPSMWKQALTELAERHNLSTARLKPNHA